MRVHAVCGYPGNSDAWAGDWDEIHWRARNLVKGVKREQFGGYAEWRNNGTGARHRQYSDEGGQRLAMLVAGSKLVDLLDAARITNASVIPVPSSQTVAAGGDYTGARLAAAIQQCRPGLLAAPVLHFDVPQPKAHDGGGERRWQVILPHLRGDAAGVGPAVLLDDVMTTGGHLRACARYLAAQGVEVADAFLIGRTMWTRPEHMFTVPAEVLIP